MKKLKFKLTPEQVTVIKEVLMGNLMTRTKTDSFSVLYHDNGIDQFVQEETAEYEDDPNFIVAWNKAFAKHAHLLKTNDRFTADLNARMIDNIYDMIEGMRYAELSYYFTQTSCTSLVKKIEKEVGPLDKYDKEGGKNKAVEDLKKRLENTLGYEIEIIKKK